MNTETHTLNDCNITVVSSDDILITDAQSALDLVMTISYQEDSTNIVLSKEALTEDFFTLSNGIAGEILQKFINYHIKVALYGDFSSYTSEALKALMRESNRGRDFFFMETKDEAIKKLASL